MDKVEKLWNFIIITCIYNERLHVRIKWLNSFKKLFMLLKRKRSRLYSDVMCFGINFSVGTIKRDYRFVVGFLILVLQLFSKKCYKPWVSERTFALWCAEICLQECHHIHSCQYLPWKLLELEVKCFFLQKCIEGWFLPLRSRILDEQRSWNRLNFFQVFGENYTKFTRIRVVNFENTR